MAASTANVTQVGASTSAVTLSAAGAGHRGTSVYNDSTAVLYLKFGAGASSTSYTTQILAGGLYELPMTPPTANEPVGGCYAGLVTGAWAAVNGNAYVTEVS